MKHIFLISLLGMFVSVSAMGAAGGGGLAGGAEVGGYVGDQVPVEGGGQIEPVPGGGGADRPTPEAEGPDDPAPKPNCGLGSYEFCPPWGCRCAICDMGFYCPDGVNEYQCPDGMEKSDEGADSIDDCYPIESPTPSRVPRRIAKDETSPECDDTTLGTASGSTDFEADWTANTINITWVGNGATVSGGATTCTYDQSFELPTPPTKTGYNFAGWKVKE